MLVLVLDDYHLGDPMFAGRLARAAVKRTVPLVIVHDSGEQGGRALEALGHIVERDDTGAWPAGTDAERRVIERAARDLNRKLVAELNENGVPAVRITGLDRGLLSLDPDGTLHCRGSAWIRSLVEQGTVPVIATLAETADGVVLEVPAGRFGVVFAGSEGKIGVLTGIEEEKVKKIIDTIQESNNQVIKGTLSELLVGLA